MLVAGAPPIWVLEGVEVRVRVQPTGELRGSQRQLASIAQHWVGQFSISLSLSLSFSLSLLPHLFPHPPFISFSSSPSFLPSFSSSLLPLPSFPLSLSPSSLPPSLLRPPSLPHFPSLSTISSFSLPPFSLPYYSLSPFSLTQGTTFTQTQSFFTALTSCIG